MLARNDNIDPITADEVQTGNKTLNDLDREIDQQTQREN